MLNSYFERTVQRTATILGHQLGVTVKIVEEFLDWQYDAGKKILQVPQWTEEAGYPYTTWIALLLHEIAHIKFSVPPVISIKEEIYQCWYCHNFMAGNRFP